MFVRDFARTICFAAVAGIYGFLEQHDIYWADECRVISKDGSVSHGIGRPRALISKFGSLARDTFPRNIPVASRRRMVKFNKELHLI